MKYSYKGTETKSSVVILTDGRAMEVRWGEKTTFVKGERRTWTSLSEWMGTLPDGAQITKSAPARKLPAKPLVTNPVLLRFMGRVKAADHSLRPFTIRYGGTRAEVVRGEKQRLVDFFTEGWQHWKSAEEHARDLAAVDGRIAALVATGTADLPVFYACGSAGYITQTADGELREVRFNKERNTIGYFRDRNSIAWAHRVLGEDFVPLTDPEMPLWRLMQGEAPKKI